MIIITDHAIDRYIERVEPCSRDEARAVMMAAERGIEAAVKMHCRVVRLDSGAKLMIRGHAVVTVINGRSRMSGHYGDLS